MTQYYVYIMTNKSGTLYVGATRNLVRRVYEHKHKLTDGFTKRYNITRLLYYEISEDFESSIAREKQIKGWIRRRKIDLFQEENPTWQDVSEGWYE